jgi:hypothetical protein
VPGALGESHPPTFAPVRRSRCPNHGAANTAGSDVAKPSWQKKLADVKQRYKAIRRDSNDDVESGRFVRLSMKPFVEDVEFLVKVVDSLSAGADPADAEAEAEEAVA